MNYPSPAAPDAMPSANILGVTRPLTIPTVIKRNTLLLATTQAFVGVGNQMVPTLGAIMVTQLLGSPALAGLATSILGGCRFLVAYPAGHVADTYGRRAGLLAGLLLSLVGAIAVGLSLMQHTFLEFLGGLVLFGLGVGAGQQLRLAAADLYPPSRRAEGLGYVLMGSLVGALGGPLLISAAQAIAPPLGLEPLALAWLLIPLIVLPSLGLVWLIHPDPKEIAANLSAYYPGQTVAPRVGLADGAPISMSRLLRNYPVRVALSTSFALQGTMAMVMAMTSLALAHHGYALPAISLAVAIHVVGMYGLSLPLGHLTDRRGRRAVMLGGVVIVLQRGFTPAGWLVRCGACDVKDTPHDFSVGGRSECQAPTACQTRGGAGQSPTPSPPGVTSPLGLFFNRRLMRTTKKCARMINVI